MMMIKNKLSNEKYKLKLKLMMMSKNKNEMMKNNTEKLKMAGIMKNTIEKLNKKNKILKNNDFFLFS